MEELRGTAIQPIMLGTPDRCSPKSRLLFFSCIIRKKSSIRRVVARATVTVLLLLAVVLLPRGGAAEPTAEVLHWSTSEREARALKVIADRSTAQGRHRIDNPLAGGGGDAAR